MTHLTILDDINKGYFAVIHVSTCFIKCCVPLVVPYNYYDSTFPPSCFSAVSFSQCIFTVCVYVAGNISRLLEKKLYFNSLLIVSSAFEFDVCSERIIAL